MRSILAEDCTLDYMSCCTDPATGRDFLRAMNVMMRGVGSWSSEGFTRYTTADVIWSVIDGCWKCPGERLAEKASTWALERGGFPGLCLAVRST